MYWHVYFSRCVNALYMGLGFFLGLWLVLQLFSVEALRCFICSGLEVQVFCRQEFDQGQWCHLLLSYLFGKESHQRPCVSCLHISSPCSPVVLVCLQGRELELVIETKGAPSPIQFNIHFKQARSSQSHLLSSLHCFWTWLIVVIFVCD